MPRSDSRISGSSSTTRMLDILRLRRGGHFGGQRKLYDELGPGRPVLFHADRAMMVFHDAPHNGQSQPFAALLGGKIRQKKFLFHFPTDAMPALSNRDLPPS